jgi:hypothetical protein
MPNVQKLHLDKALTNISIGYSNEQFIADKIFLPVSVDKQSDRYYVFGKEMFRQHDDKRAPGTEASEINWTLSLDTYFCEGHALRTPIADEEQQNADDVFDLESDGTELVTEGILLNKEIAAAEMLLDSSNYDSELVFNMGAAGNPAKWSDYLTSPTNYTSDPVLDIAKAKEKMHKKSGIRPNTLVISEPIYNVLKLHPKILKLFSGIAPVSIANEEQIRLALGVDRIIVGSALKSGATNPAQEDNLDYIWGNSAVLCYVPAKPGKKVKAIGYTFMWNKDGNGAVQVRKWYEQGRRATIIEAERWYAHKIISNVAGFLFADAVAPLSA